MPGRLFSKYEDYCSVGLYRGWILYKQGGFL